MKENNLNKLLKIDKNFIPASEDEGDELYQNGFFVFNISKIIKYIKENSDIFIPEKLSVKDFPYTFANLNEKHINSVNFNEPVILAEISPERYNLIDGNHRMEKAKRSGIEFIMAYRLNVNLHINFLTSIEAYYAYINYWNGKVKDLN